MEEVEMVEVVVWGRWWDLVVEGAGAGGKGNQLFPHQGAPRPGSAKPIRMLSGSELKFP